LWIDRVVAKGYLIELRDGKAVRAPIFVDNTIGSHECPEVQKRSHPDDIHLIADELKKSCSPPSSYFPFALLVV